MIKQTREKGATFADVWLSHTEKKWEQHWLKKIQERVNWNKFQYRFEQLYAKGEGRPAWDPILLFRCLLLAQWYGLSDRDLEEAMGDRISFRKFVGMRWEEESPDATTFAVFRERITLIMEKLLRILNEQLETAGFEIQKVKSVDATLVEAHSKPLSGEGGDAEAAWRGFPMKTVVHEDGTSSLARRPALFGFKVHLGATVGTGFVSEVFVTAANEHESQHLKPFLGKGTLKVYGDKGYASCAPLLQGKGILSGLQRRAYRNRPLSEAQVRRNQRITTHRRIVEGVFGSWKQWYGWRKTKYLGLIKNQLAVTLTALSWNMKKWAFLSP